ncbi:unnamed protein product [Ectocarpus sp. 4 AP-2014]
MRIFRPNGVSVFALVTGLDVIPSAPRPLTEGPGGPQRLRYFESAYVDVLPVYPHPLLKAVSADNLVVPPVIFQVRMSGTTEPVRLMWLVARWGCDRAKVAAHGVMNSAKPEARTVV